MNRYAGHSVRAEYWDPLPEGGVECRLCPHHCRIREGHAGLCKVRGVIRGELRALGYGEISSCHVDPVEKKPLYHFHPGARIFSVGGWGCNLGCVFCQNWEISQTLRSGPRYMPDELLGASKAEGCSLVAYTYNEPLVGFEFVRDCCQRVRADGGKNVLVTNGYVEEAPARELLPLVDALNIDIKSMDDAFYRQHCKGTLPPVLRFCRQAVQAGCHVEITNLIIPGLNDSNAGIEMLAAWVRDELGSATPLHFSAYHPDFRAMIEPTPPATVSRAWELARKYLTYVYMGNLSDGKGQNTECPGCGRILVERHGFKAAKTGLNNGVCDRCGRKADLIL